MLYSTRRSSFAFSSKISTFLIAVVKPIPYDLNIFCTKIYCVKTGGCVRKDLRTLNILLDPKHFK